MSGRSNPLAPHHVYRCYDADDVLLYIGCTVNVERRIKHHKWNDRTHRWAQQVARVESDRYESWAEGRDAERQAIIAEQPKHNVQLIDRSLGRGRYTWAGLQREMAGLS